jgi:hypothetical protein
MSAKEIVTELGAYELRSGRRVSFEHVEHLDYESAHVFNVISQAGGRRYCVRVPVAALAALRLALEVFEARVQGGRD